MPYKRVVDFYNKKCIVGDRKSISQFGGADVRIPLAFAALLYFAVPATAQQVDQRLWECLTRVVYGEQRNPHLPIAEKYAIAWTVIFRAWANVPEFGGSDLCSVAAKSAVNKNGKLIRQYDGYWVEVTDVGAWDASAEITYWVLLGYGKPNIPVMHFCAPGSCGGWHDVSPNLGHVGLMGGHQFYIDYRFPQLMEASAQ